MDYYDEYKSRNPQEFVELMIIANRIPRERRDRLSSYGIAFKEIPETLFSSGTDVATGSIPVPEDRIFETLPEAMPMKGDIFKGKINDLCQDDASGWRRRDVSFFKHDLLRGRGFGYPTQNDRIILTDTDENRFELNFSKPESDKSVCLGTPGKLKQWYLNKGFELKVVNPNDEIYFEYTGNSNVFLILTKEEYHKRLSRGQR